MEMIYDDMCEKFLLSRPRENCCCSTNSFQPNAYMCVNFSLVILKIKMVLTQYIQVFSFIQRVRDTRSSSTLIGVNTPPKTVKCFRKKRSMKKRESIH